VLLIALAAIIGVPGALLAYGFLAEKLVGSIPGARARSRVRPLFWLLPAFLLMGVFLIYPAVSTVDLSLRSANSSRFVGLANYAALFTDRATLVAMRNNLLWLVLGTLGTVTLGLLVAVLTDRVRYESVAKALIFLPMAISSVAAGVIWKLMYEFRPPGTPQIGTVNAVLTAVDPAFQPRAWLFNPPGNNIALIVAYVWIWTGFAMVILSAGLKGISRELIEAARIDGATEWGIFVRVILPLMRSTLTVVATTIIIGVLKVFDIVYVMTNGALDTEVIANRMYKEMFNFQNFGRASAIAVVLLLAITPVMAANIRRFGQRRARS
jgi:alpha-glucoside transport system permease protein